MTDMKNVKLFLEDAMMSAISGSLIPFNEGEVKTLAADLTDEKCSIEIQGVIHGVDGDGWLMTTFDFIIAKNEEGCASAMFTQEPEDFICINDEIVSFMKIL